MNRQLGNLLRIFVRERHKNWATYVKAIATCLNETYHETIEMTPFEAHFGKRPKREWEKYLDVNATNSMKVDMSKIHLRIREKGLRQADRLNKQNKTTEFAIGDKVLVHAYNTSDATQNIIAKFCALYEGPYVINKKIGKATYELTNNNGHIRGIFNIRQLKKYHSISSS